jgi:tetratricopeptide (TPR) repeat protein
LKYQLFYKTYRRQVLKPFDIIKKRFFALESHQEFITIRLMQKFLALLLVSSFLFGCNQNKKSADAEDSSNPFYKKAAEYETDQNFPAAIKEYESALRANPKSAKAHLQMGLIYSEKLNDPISGIYHFQQYLNDRPNSTDKELVQTYIEKAKFDFSSALPNSPLQNSEEVAKISKENIELKQTLAKAQMEIAQKDSQLAEWKSKVESLNSQISTLKAQVAAQPAPAPATPVVSTTPHQETKAGAANAQATSADGKTPSTTPAQSSGPRYHVIGKGDSLWKIASKYYPGEALEGVQKIKQANPEATSNEKNLKLGQKLLIP